MKLFDFLFLVASLKSGCASLPGVRPLASGMLLFFSRFGRLRFMESLPGPVLAGILVGSLISLVIGQFFGFF